MTETIFFTVFAGQLTATAMLPALLWQKWWLEALGAARPGRVPAQPAQQPALPVRPTARRRRPNEPRRDDPVPAGSGRQPAATGSGARG